jgi:hypothetical protein
MDQKLIRWVTPAPVDADARRRLRDTLADIQRENRRGPVPGDLMPFATLRKLHFASITLFDEGPHQNDPVLVFESNIDRFDPKFDGQPMDYVRALVASCRGGLDAIYDGSTDYPGRGATNKAVEDWLKRLKRVVQLHHEGHPHQSLEAIEGDHELHRSIAEALKDPEIRKASPAAIIKRLRGRVPKKPWWVPASVLHPRRPKEDRDDRRGDPLRLEDFEWIRDRRSWLRAHFILVFATLGWVMGFCLTWVLPVIGITRPYALGVVFALAFVLMYQASVHAKIIKATFIAAAVTFVVYLPFRYLLPANPAPPWWITAVLAALLIPGIFLLASSVKVATTLPLTRTFDRLSAAERDRFRALLEAEDRPENGSYNHVAGLSVLKCHHRRLRWWRSYLTLRLLNLFYRSLYIRGRLLSIPSIHFAQWSLIDDHRLLFVTNYDGQADSYLDDFFTALATGVAFIWIDTEEFPGTIDPRHLKIWVRRGQTLAGVRYRAPIYNGLTVGAINSNAEIRMRFLSGWRDSTARRWLSRFGVAVEEPTLTAQLWTRIKSMTSEV